MEMTALEKLNALQAGELDKVLPHGNHNGIAAYTVSLENNNGELAETIHQIHWAKQNKLNAAKVEVTKAWLPEIIGAIDALLAADERGQGVGYAEAMNRLRKMLPELKKLKESL